MTGRISKWVAVALVAIVVVAGVGYCLLTPKTSSELETGTTQRTSLLTSSEQIQTETSAQQTWDPFEEWWQQYKEPVELDTSKYPSFYRGAWASRLDEAREYLANARSLRKAGVDTIMLGVDIVLDPETGEPRSLGDEAFIFYIQALRKAGFRMIVVPNPAHPNFDMGKGFAWGGLETGNETYRASPGLLRKFTPVVMRWARIAEEFRAYGFVPMNEPHAFAGDVAAASQWLQEVLPGIRASFSGKVGAVDIMCHLDDCGVQDIPFPYDYSGYDFILGGPPAGRKNAAEWGNVVKRYIEKGSEYARKYGLDGFGLYEWGGYRGGVWYEDVQMCIYGQCLSDSEAARVTETGVGQMNRRIVGSFPRISTGWIMLNSSAFAVLSEWYLRVDESNASPIDSKEWSYDEVVLVERRLARGEYGSICTLDWWSTCSGDWGQRSHSLDRLCLAPQARAEIPNQWPAVLCDASRTRYHCFGCNCCRSTVTTAVYPHGEAPHKYGLA